VAASAATGSLNGRPQDVSGTGESYCLNISTNEVFGGIEQSIPLSSLVPSITDGQFALVPTWESGRPDHINVGDAPPEGVRRFYFSNLTHDNPVPVIRADLPGTKATTAAPNLYLIDPNIYSVSRSAVFGILAYSVDNTTGYAVNM